MRCRSAAEFGQERHRRVNLRRPFLPELESLRGVAALLVAAYHISWQSHVATWPLVRNAGLMVDLFFVLSGFVICHVYIGQMDVLQFMRARFARLYPLHLLCLLGFLGIECAKWIAVQSGVPIASQPFAINNWHSFIPNLLLIQAMGILDRGTWNIPSWSISVEFFVYLLFAAIARTRALLPGAIILASLGVATCWYETGSLTGTFRYSFFRCMAGFFSGVIAWHLHSKVAFPPYFRILLGAVLVLFLARSTTGATEFLSIPLFMALVIACSKTTASPLVYLGSISYSIYMVHALIVWTFEFVLQYLLRLPRDPLYQTGCWTGDVLALLYLAAVIGVSSITYKRVEVPLRNWLNPQ